MSGYVFSHSCTHDCNSFTGEADVKDAFVLLIHEDSIKILSCVSVLEYFLIMHSMT